MGQMLSKWCNFYILYTLTLTELERQIKVWGILHEIIVYSTPAKKKVGRGEGFDYNCQVRKIQMQVPLKNNCKAEGATTVRRFLSDGCGRDLAN